MAAIYTSSIDRLRNLPDVFSSNTLARLMGIEKESVNVYLSRWAESGFIQPSGPRTGIFFNVLKNPEAKQDFFHDAVLMEYPAAILGGESILHAAGWITQIPQNMQLMVPSRRSYLGFYGCEFQGRPVSWFKKVDAFIIGHTDAEFSTYGFRALHPAMALADLFNSKDGWKPDPDDIEIPEDEIQTVIYAFDALGQELPKHYGLEAYSEEESKAKAISPA